jgi:hypothetical protein
VLEVTLETRRRVLTLAVVQFPPILIAAVEYDLEGALTNTVVGASGVTALIACAAMSFRIRFTRCGNCGERYFSRIPFSFFISRRCASCGVKDGEHAGSYWGRR